MLKLRIRLDKKVANVTITIIMHQSIESLGGGGPGLGRETRCFCQILLKIAARCTGITVIYCCCPLRRCMIGGDLNSDIILCCHNSSRPISRAHPASARSKIFVGFFHKIKSWNLRNLCILVEHAPGVGYTATELVPASGDECYLLIFSWAVSPHVPPPSQGFNWLVHKCPGRIFK